MLFFVFVVVDALTSPLLLLALLPADVADETLPWNVKSQRFK